ncbi:hypothetical protein C7N43_17415 [Sphingobacteriales bacterium UPWRP_1]|nr:hypothetical protein BVG80_04145 [Sphingobacteriales bacterium TSM_CSM]PSJ75745.1 hypothetical protein C7N43_17415 [Sphingobacteriales bacterium UPWRP_1]
MGFAKAFEYAEIKELTLPISKNWGIIWLLGAALFVFCALFFLLKKENWFAWAWAGILVSQLLIVVFWTDARFGTLANLLILPVSLIAWGQWSFNRMANTELQNLLQTAVTNTATVTEADIAQLPQPVQQWLRQSGVVGKPYADKIQLWQNGTMRTTQNGKWMPFEARQWFATVQPAFLWQTEVKMMPGVFLVGRDKYENGKGNMLIKALSLFTVANAKGPETDQGTLVRYLAEIVWFPSAALSKYIQWEATGSNAAKATMTYGGTTASVLFRFSDDGKVLACEAKRYYTRNNGATLEDWHVEIDPNSYKTFQPGITIPVRSGVTWKLKEGDFNWLKVEVTQILYNADAY